MAQGAGQRLASHPGRVADDQVEPARGHDVGEMHGVVEGGQAAVACQPAARGAQVAPQFPGASETGPLLARQSALPAEQRLRSRMLEQLGDPRLDGLDRPFQRRRLGRLLRLPERTEGGALGAACRTDRRMT